MSGEEHRSRTAWPGPLSVAGVGEGHTHELPVALRQRYRMLMVAVVALLLAVGTLTYFVYRQQQYVEGRGEYRDRENDRTNQRINDAICDLLDQLPEGGLLERPRAKYGCGPGIPIDRLTPEEQQQLADRLPQTVPASEDPPDPADPAPFSGGAVGPPVVSSQPPAPARPTLPN